MNLFLFLLFVVVALLARVQVHGQEVNGAPTSQPSGEPTSEPTMPTGQPTSEPTSPTGQPTGLPSGQPSTQPTSEPSRPSPQPTPAPTEYFPTTLVHTPPYVNFTYWCRPIHYLGGPQGSWQRIDSGVS